MQIDVTHRLPKAMLIKTLRNATEETGLVHDLHS